MSIRNSITIGQAFSRLTVIAEAPRRKHQRYWLCQCSCGSLPKEIRQDSLGSAVKSCGCLRKEVASNSAARTGKLNKTHGKSRTPEYRIWDGMWQRCTNPRNASYESYKERTPPKEWLSFEVFIADMGLRPSPKHSIERVNNYLSYGPDNCKWVEAKEQLRNTSANVNLTYNGKTQCLAAWVEELGISYGTLHYRLKVGWPIEKALTTKGRN